MSQQVGGAEWDVVAAGDVHLAGEQSPHADFIACACRVQEACDDTLGPGGDTAESAEEAKGADRALVAQHQP